MEIFGWEFKRPKEEDNASFVPKQDHDGAVIVESAGIVGTFLDLEGSIRTEAELVNRYRDMAEYPEVDSAIDDIVNEIVTQESDKKIVELVLDDLDQAKTIKDLFVEEFDEILSLLEFNKLAYEIVRTWYMDGRLYYHAIIDDKSPQDGIKELRYIDPRKIRKIKEVKKKRASNNLVVQKDETEYFIFNEKGFAKTNTLNTTTSSVSGVKIAKDSIVYCTSGLVSGDLVKSYLHKAIKPLNQLKAMEDSLVIYRISRAPERRIFYVDVGNLPKAKAEQYVSNLMTRFKNKTVYNSATGEIRNDKNFMTMLEDFWLPRREGGKGTEISTLPGGQNLGQMDDVLYFQKKLYRSLNVPITRMEPETVYNLGRSSEITRDEVKFSKFIERLRTKFSNLFLNIFQKQLVLKNIISIEEWDTIKDQIKFKFAIDNYWAEAKDTEILRDRITMLRDVDDYLGKYFSGEWIRRNVLHMSDEEIQEIDKQINSEKSDPRFSPPEMDPNAEGGSPNPPDGLMPPNKTTN